MSRLAALGVMLGIAALAACGNETIVSSPPTTMTIIAGNSQSAYVGLSLPNPLEVAVTTSSGVGVAGVTVDWAVTTGAGTLSASSVTTDGQGRASVTWTLGGIPGGQSVSATVTGLSGSPATFSAIATAPIVIHYDGTTWSTALEDVNGAHVSLESIWGATPSAVFAVGESRCGGSVVLRFDGTSWGQPPPSCVGVSLEKLTSVWGSSASDVFYTDRNGLPPKLGGSILHFDGQRWSYYEAPCPTGIICPAFQAGWSSSPTDAFAVGDRGMMAHYDGTNWSQQASVTTELLNGVWGLGPASAVFAVGGGGTILSYDRSTWRAQSSGTTQPLYAVWGMSANNVFAVGAAGTILRYDGTAWTAHNSGTTQSLYGVWGTSGNDVFAVGDASTILHYDGTKWSAQTTAALISLRGVWGSSPTNVFAVGP